MKNHSSDLVHYRLSYPFTLNLSTNNSFVHIQIVLRLIFKAEGQLHQSC